MWVWWWLHVRALRVHDKSGDRWCVRKTDSRSWCRKPSFPENGDERVMIWCRRRCSANNSIQSDVLGRNFWLNRRCENPKWKRWTKPSGEALSEREDWQLTMRKDVWVYNTRMAPLMAQIIPDPSTRGNNRNIEENLSCRSQRKLRIEICTSIRYVAVPYRWHRSWSH